MSMSTEGQGHSVTLIQIIQIQYFLNFFSSITADFNISSALRWALQDQWSSGFFSSRLSYLPFLMPHLLGDGWTYWNTVVSAEITQRLSVTTGDVLAMYWLTT